MYKRILCLFLTFAMVFGMMPISVSAAEAELSFVDTQYGNEITVLSGTTVGPATVVKMSVYEQGTYACLPIVRVTQDGKTFNITLAEEMNPSAAVQVGLTGSTGAMFSYGSNSNKCTLVNGQAKMEMQVYVRVGAATAGPETFTVNFFVPMGDPCTVTKPEGEGFTFVGPDSAYIGSSYSFQIQVDEEYDASNMVVKVNDAELEGTGGSYTVENVDSDSMVITVEGIEKKTVYAVSLPEGEGFRVSGGASVYAGDDYSFTVSVEEGYSAENMEVCVNGEAVEASDGKYTLKAASEDLEITVTGVAKRVIHTITLPEGEGFTASGAATVYAGDNYSFTVTVAEGYTGEGMEVCVNGEAVEVSGGKYTVVAVAEDLEITVTGVVKRVVHTVILPEGEGYSVSGAESVYAGDSYSFTVAVAEGYSSENMEVAANGEILTASGTQYTVDAVTEDLVITVAGVETKTLCTVTIPSGKGYIATGEETVYLGDNYSFTVNAKAGFLVTVLVNGEEVTGVSGKYTVENVSGNLEITVNASRVPLPEKELSVSNNVIDITDKTVYSLSKYYAKAVNIQISGINVKEAYEDGTTVYVILPYTAPDVAQVDVTFGTSLNRCTMTGTTASVMLSEGEADLRMTLTGAYVSSMKGSATYNMIFIREEVPLNPPVLMQETAEGEFWCGHSLTIDLREYFSSAEKFYLVDGETKTLIDGSSYTVSGDQAAVYTLKFAAENVNGMCQDLFSYTVTAKAVEAGLHIGYTSGNGSMDTVEFKNADGTLIKDIKVSLEGQTIQVVLPKDYPIDGKVTAVFALTQNDGLPFITTKTGTSGTSSDKAINNKFTEKTITLASGAANLTFYYYNTTPKTNSNSYVTWKLNIVVANELPVLAEGIEATAQATITAGKNFQLDLAPLFTDADGDELSYLVSIGGAAAVRADSDYTFTTDTAGEYTLVFTANDGKNNSQETYTVILTVENMAETSAMTVSVPEGIEPQFYVCAGYNSDGIDQQGAEIAVTAGETANGMTAYTLNYPSNATVISVRSEKWGGMAFSAEADGIVSVRSVQMSAVDYKGDPAQITGSVSYNGHTAFAGEEGWLLVTGEEYTYRAVPVDASLSTITVTETLEANAETLKLELELMIKDPVTITVSTGAKAQLYQIDTSRYYVAKEIEAKLIKDNEDGTTTYYYSASGNDLVYHVSMEGKISKAGYFEWNQKNINAVYTDADKADSYRLDDYSASGQENSSVTEDSVVLNVNSRNHLSLSVGESKTLKAYRIWEIIKISYQNYILTPDFTYTVLAGQDVVSLTPVDSPSTANGDWMTLTALKEGIAIIEVSYDAMQTVGGSYDGIYGASDPNRTGLVVVQVGGKNDTTVDFGIECFASAGISGSKNISYNPNAKRAWDVEFDTLYFTEETGTLKLSPTASSDITQVAVSNDKGATWTSLGEDNGVYTATIVPGNNVIRVTTVNGDAYQVVRGDRVNVVLNEIDGSSDGDGIVEAGEGVRVTLVGLHMPIPKMAGNYNPGYYGNTDGFSSVHLNYSNNGTPIYGPGTQYNFITAANYVELTMPEDGSAVTLDNGYIGVGVLGLQNFTTGGDSHRNIPDAGCTTRDTKTTYHTRSILPVITIQAGGESAPNTAPAVRVNALTTGEIFDDQKFAINPESLFFDADEDVLHYTVSVNGGEAVTVGATYKFAPDTAGVYTLVFTASDKEASAQHTVTVTVKERPAPEEEKNEFGFTESEIAGWVSVTFEDNGIRVKGETGLKYPEALGTIIEATSVPFLEGETVAQVTIRLLDHMKIGYEYSGTPTKGFYLGAIKNFEVDHTPYDVMGEFDAGIGSGWMITLNDEFINKGASDFKVADGDVVRWQYTCQLGADIGDTYDKEAAKVKELIDAIGTVSMDSEEAIEAARTAYEALTDAQKTAVTNYEKLTAAETALEQLKLAANDQAAADAVEEKIEAIGTVTLASEEKINEAQTAYNALTAQQKKLVSNYDLLTAAQATLEQLKIDAANQAAADAVKVKIDAIGTVTLDDETQINSAREAYEALSKEQKALVSNYQTLVDAENELLRLKASAADQAAADAVKEKIEAIGSVTLDSGTAIAEARTAYNALTDAQKALVSNIQVLNDAEKQLNLLEASAADQAAAKLVEEKIDAIGTVSLDSEENITEARSAFDALNDKQKALVTNAQILNDAEEQLAKLKADQVAVQNVQKTIAAIGTVTLASEEKIEAARAAYEALSAQLKNQVSNYDVLLDAEATLEQLKQEAKDQAAAEQVKELIDSIGTVNLSAEKAIVAARKAYNGLTDAQKALVSNYETLTKAEAALEELKQANAGFETIYNAIGDYLESLGTPIVNPIGGEWMVIGLVRSGREVPAGYYDEVVKYVRENINDAQQLHRAKSTENARVILALTAAGYDVTDVDGHNLLVGLNSMSYVKKQGNNGAIWALIAFDSYDYEIPEGDVSREALINSILATQLADGGWSMSSVATSGDSDLTAMAVQALAPYYSTNAAVKTAIDKALALLAKLQLADGSFGSVDGSCAESTAQVIVALCSMGIDPAKDNRFIKNGSNTVDALLRFYVSGEGFRHTPEDTETNGMATEQGYYALTAYDRFLNGKSFLFDMTDLKPEEDPDVHTHSFGQWTVVEEAKISKEGLEVRECACGEKETRVIEKLAFPFTDVKETSYAYDTVAWAVDENITTGMTATTFEPSGEVTRGQVVTFLWRAAGSPKASVADNPFTDVEEGKFYYEAVLWAVEMGITNGRTATTFAPKDTCTRAEVVTFLWRFAGKPDVSGAENPFTDLVEGKFYCDAVLWAVDTGITTGVTEDTFGPSENCKRAQIVTFLYRYINK